MNLIAFAPGDTSNKVVLPKDEDLWRYAVTGFGVKRERPPTTAFGTLCSRTAANGRSFLLIGPCVAGTAAGARVCLSMRTALTNLQHVQVVLTQQEAGTLRRDRGRVSIQFAKVVAADPALARGEEGRREGHGDHTGTQDGP